MSKIARSEQEMKEALVETALETPEGRVALAQ